MQLRADIDAAERPVVGVATGRADDVRDIGRGLRDLALPAV
ncbi:hypothetical protein ACFWUQ_17270 [Streptomyces sp. NPDC058662]